MYLSSVRGSAVAAANRSNRVWMRVFSAEEIRRLAGLDFGLGFAGMVRTMACAVF